MKTLDDFRTRWQDEITGLLLRAFADADATKHARLPGRDMAEAGCAMRQQLARARTLIEQMYYDLAGQVPAIAAKQNGQPTRTAEPAKR